MIFFYLWIYRSVYDYNYRSIQMFNDLYDGNQITQKRQIVKV